MSRVHGHVHPSFARVGEIFEGMLPKGPGGAALAVVHRGETVVELAGGTRDADGNPFTSDTLALSFSTTKGVASTLVHILASEGRIRYDRPMADYWPAFGAAGKQRITVRDVMTHRAGLYSIRDLVDDVHEMRDWDGMLRRIEATPPHGVPSTRPAYHGLTYGWLVGGLVEHVTGQRFGDVLREKLVEPLGLTGCYVGLPASELARAARLVRLRDRPRSSEKRGGSKGSARSRLQRRAMAAVTRALGFDGRVFRDALLAKGARDFDWTSDETLASCIPAASGAFDARSLARIYMMLANGGEFGGKRFIDPATFRELSRVQTTERDRVLPMPMAWRLGYHRVLSLGRQSNTAFGHFGFGGSGAFCDPARKLAVGFVLNHGVGTPFGDARIWRLAGAALSAASR